MNLDFLLCAIRELIRNKHRTLALFTGYAIAVSLLLVITAVTVFSKVHQTAVIGTTGTHFVTWLPSCGDLSSLTEEELAKLALGIIPEKCKQNCENCTGCNKKPRDILNEGFVINTNTTRLLTIDLANEINKLPGVRNASPFLMFRFRDPTDNKLFTVGGLFLGHLAVETNSCGTNEIIEGQYLSENSFNKVLVDDGYALNNGLKVGSKVIIAEEEFEVIGIAATGADPVKAEFYMLFSEAERVINRRIHNPLENEANIILVESVNGTVHGQVMEDVMKLMKNDSILTSGCYYPASKAIGLNEKLLWVFIAVILVSSILMTVKLQLSFIAERQRDVAILKAIGWSNSSVIKQMLSESFIISAIGCGAGVLISGLLLCVVPIEHILGIEMNIGSPFNALSMVAVVMFSIFSGVFSGLIPVLFVLKKHPLEVLRRC